MQNLLALRKAFTDFFRFAPRTQSLILLLMLIQGLTAGIGLLFVIPLLKVVGVDFGGHSTDFIAHITNQALVLLGLDNSLIIVLTCYIMIVCALASLRYKLAIMSAATQQRYISFVRNRLYRSLLNSQWQYIVENKMSDFTHSLSGQVQSIGHASHLMLSLLSQLILAGVMLFLVCALSWKMTLLALCFATVMLILLLPLNRLVYGSGKRELMSYKHMFQMLTEQLGSLKMIKSYASESYHADLMQKTSNTLEAQHTRLARMNAISQWIYMTGAVVGFSVLFYTANEVLTIPLSTTLLLLLIFSRLLPQLSSLQQTYQQLIHKLPAFKDVDDMLSGCQSAQELVDFNTKTHELTKAIRLRNISYYYPGKTQPVFKNLSLDINKNETLALIGHSGAGKTTLADIIAGLLEQSSGQLCCDNTLLEPDNRLAWRKNIAYVTQEVYLFHDSIRANLTWVLPEKVNDEYIWRVLKLAAADDFVRTLPLGLDTMIGDRGVRLSGGERQRLALARALLAKPTLLILDEATSALDHQNELKIQKALEQLQGKLTIIVIAHRETTIAHADKKFDLSEIATPNSCTTP